MTKVLTNKGQSVNKRKLINNNINKIILPTIKSKLDRFVMVVMPLMMSFVLGSFLSIWLVVGVNPEFYELIIIIMFSVMLFLYVYEQMKEVEGK